MRKLCPIFALLALSLECAVPVQALQAFQLNTPVQQGAALSSSNHLGGPERYLVATRGHANRAHRRSDVRRRCLRLSAAVEQSVSAVLQSKRKQAWQLFASFVRAVLCQAAVILAFFFFDPGRVNAGLVYEGQSAGGVNVVYMDKDWHPVEFVGDGDGAAAPHVTAYGRGKEHEDVDLCASETMTKQEKRLAAIKREMAMMKQQREEEMLRQPWFNADKAASMMHQQSNGIPHGVKYHAAVSESVPFATSYASASASDDVASMIDDHAFREETRAMQGATERWARYVSEDTTHEAVSAAYEATFGEEVRSMGGGAVVAETIFRPHVTMYTRGGGGERMLAEPTPEAATPEAQTPGAQTPEAAEKSPSPSAAKEEQPRAQTPDFIRAMGESAAPEAAPEAVADAAPHAFQDPHISKAYSRGDEAEHSGDHKLATGTPPPESVELDLSEEVQSPEPSTEYLENEFAPGPTTRADYGSNAHAHRRADGALIYTFDSEPAQDSQPVEGQRSGRLGLAIERMDSQPSAECDSDIPGLQTYTESVRFLETYTGNPEFGGPEELAQRDASPPAARDHAGVEQAADNFVSMMLKLTLGVVVAYSESPEVRQAVDPVLSVVSEPAQAVGKSAGKVAVGAGKLALATGKYVGHQTVAASKLVGHHALSTSKVVGAGVGKATVASGMTLSDSAVLAGRAVGRMMLGEAPVARVGVVGASADATASQDPRSGYEFVGEKRQSMYEFVGEKRQSDAPVPVPQHPNVGHIGSVESPAPTTASSYLCGLDRVTAIVGTSLVTAASAGLGIRAVAARGREKGDSSTVPTMYDSLLQLIGLKSPGGATDAKSSGQTGGSEKAGEGEDKTKQFTAVATEVVSKEDTQAKRLRVVFNDETHVPQRGAGDADEAVEAAASPTGDAAAASAVAAAGGGAAGAGATNSSDRDLLKACMKIYNVYMQEFEKQHAGDGTAAGLKEDEDAADVTEVLAKLKDQQLKSRVGTKRRVPPPVPRVSEGARQERAVGKSAGKSAKSGGVGSSSVASTSTGKTMLQYQRAAVTAE